MNEENRETYIGYIKHQGKNVPVTVIYKKKNPTEEDKQNAQAQVEQYCTQAGKQLFNYMKKYQQYVVKEENIKDAQNPRDSSH